MCEIPLLVQIRLTFHPGGEISDTLIGMLLDIIEHDPGYHNVFRLDSQPVYGVENVSFGLLLDVVVVLEHYVSELFAARIHELTLYVRSGEARYDIIGIPPFLEVDPTLSCNSHVNGRAVRLRFSGCGGWGARRRCIMFRRTVHSQ